MDCSLCHDGARLQDSDEVCPDCNRNREQAQAGTPIGSVAQPKPAPQRVSPENLVVGKTYYYQRPDWKSPVKVSIEMGRGDFAGEIQLRFRQGFIPSPLKGIPADAFFTELDG